MKRITIICTGLLFLILIFFTLYGGEIYEHITPKVKAVALNAMIVENDESYIQIPKSALTNDNCVYLIITEQGFSRTLYTVQKTAVKYIELPNIDINSVYVTSGISRGDRIISELEGNLLLEDGDRVIVE